MWPVNLHSKAAHQPEWGKPLMITRSSCKNISNATKRTALSIALGMCVAGGVHAQSTSGGINGTVAGGGDSAVVISNNSGFSRTVTTDAAGRYNISSLPIGEYTVTAQRNGQTVGTRHVSVIVGRSTDVSFGGDAATTLEVVTVTGTNVPAIDVTALDTRTVITSEQLQRLPVDRTAESVALLAPGAIAGAGGFQNLRGLVSFGGAGVSENAYYINGYFSGEPVSNLGGFTLPFGSIDQQETFTGGYSARYGRSAGGVINQIGKRGTNELHFGGQVALIPKSLKSDQKDIYNPDLDFSNANANPNLPSRCGEDLDGDGEGDELCQYGYSHPEDAGKLFSRGKEDYDWSSTYSGYIGGPLIQDRLFAFVSAETTMGDAFDAPTLEGNGILERSTTSNPKIYAKLDWNINDSNLLEYTYLGEKFDSKGQNYDYDFDTGTTGEKLATVPNPESQNREFSILKYTGYWTENLTFNALYGRGHFSNKQINPAILPGLVRVGGAQNQDPAIVGDSPIGGQLTDNTGIDARDYTEGLRADLEWVLGDHTLTTGIDNIKFEAENEGQAQVAPRWNYFHANNPLSPIDANLGVGAPGGNGYYVSNRVLFTSTSMSLEQKAWFLEDRWQITDNFLLSLGIRNDEFVNKNNFGEAYMEAKDQWAPRIGASWDVFGDSTFRLFANAGRYFLAMPNNVAIRGASASTNTNEYFTYTGIDANGAPTGLTPVPGLNGAPPPGPVSANGELGLPVDVLAFAPSDLKNMYQDEYILGFDKTLGSKWAYGAKLTYRDLKSSIDDVCDSSKIVDKMESLGLDPDSVQIANCYMFNPGGTNTFSLANADGNGRTEVVMTAADWGFEQGVKRVYKALDLYLEHPFDGKWEGRIDYTYSKLEGNNEGQVKSEFGQTNISKTQDWDAAEIMAFSDGYLFNDRRHQLKVRGSYQVTPQWMVSGKLTVLSGTPVSCLGLFNPDGSIFEGDEAADPISYGSSYHTCLGSVAKPGDVRTGWTHKLDLGVTYRPSLFDDKLAFGVQVFNALNERKATQLDVTSEDADYTIRNAYLRPLSMTTPRFVMFTATLNY